MMPCSAMSMNISRQEGGGDKDGNDPIAPIFP